MASANPTFRPEAVLISRCSLSMATHNQVHESTHSSRSDSKYVRGLYTRVNLVRRIKKATKKIAANAATGIKVDRKAESEVEPVPELAVPEDDYHRQRLSMTINWVCPEEFEMNSGRVDKGLPFWDRVATRSLSWPKPINRIN